MSRPSPELENQLDYSKPDDEVVGCFHRYTREQEGSDVRLLTHDGGPMMMVATAKGLGLPFEPIPDNWLLPPENNPMERENVRLKEEVNRLKKTEPELVRDPVCSGKPPVLIRWVLIRDPQGSFATQALLCTDPAADPTQILEWFVLRWQLEVTFHEVRTHLGVETQRQWSDLAIARTTPALRSSPGRVGRSNPWNANARFLNHCTKAIRRN